MIIKLVGEGLELTQLQDLVNVSLTELGLLDLVTLETTADPAYKMELGITQNPALCIEESSIDFKDMIFEGVVPEKSELTSMFVSILGSSESEEGGGCSTGGSCGSCSTGGCS
ncbi:MAG: hypothetical protein PHU93_05185 [Candidatus Gracilibacteria bacterium]|nr:hypothetical protein [Candidatus Gracilibacteria bacterium]